MLGPYVCKQCRARLTRRIVPIRNPQWQPRATFLSFRNRKPQDQTEAAQSEAQSLQDHLEDGSHSRPRIRHTSDYEQPRGRYSQLVDDRADDRVGGEHLLDVVPRTNDDGPSEHGDGPAVAIRGVLEARMGRGDVDKAWAIFEENYTSRNCKALTEPLESDVVLLKDGRIFNDLLHKINGAFCGLKVKPLVTPTKVLFKYEQLGLATPELWTRQTIPYLTYKAMFMINAPSAEASDLASILSELLSVWRLFFQCKGRKAHLDTISQEWNLPAIKDMPLSYDSKDFNLRMQDYHPGQVGNPTLGFCAVYFYTLSDALGAVQSLRKEAEPFIKFLERLLAGSSVLSVFNHSQTSANFKKNLPKEVQDDILNEINTSPSRALAHIGSQGATLGDSAGDTPDANLETWQLKRIARAVLSKKSTGVLNVLWGDMQRSFTKDGKPAIPRRIYNAFLSGFLVMFQAQSSVKVWNHMIAHGVQPDIQSWVALLQGCERAGDLDGFNTMWKRMLNTGIEPDVYAWTTRVHGLFYLRNINDGLATLDDMGRRWLLAEQAIHQPKSQHKGAKKSSSSAKVVNKCTKPSIEVINGAITALVQISTRNLGHDKRVQYVQKLLGWASNFAIKPDAITYNSLIQLYLRAGDYATAFKVLHQMEKDGIAADVATHTMLISASFDNGSFNNLTEAQQIQKIIGLLNDLEAGGFKLNDYVYSTAIDRLLKNFSNHNAVRSIIDHMTARNMSPSAYAYTSLITYYFQQSPPPMPAIDSLVNTFFTSHRVPTDQVLFDRTIEGYASHGETGKMMSVLTRMSKLGTLPGWNALVVVIEALCKDGERDRARKIVRDVEGGIGVGGGGVVGGMTGEKRFFHVARQLGLWSEDERNVGQGEERMDYEFIMGDRATRASRNEKVLGEQLREQEIGQMLQKEEAQDGLDRPLSTPAAQQGVRNAQKHASPPVEEEENVHGFLTDDHEDMHSRVQ